MEGRQVEVEIAELVELFPQVKPEELPQGVWQEVQKGRNLALAYCLWRLGEQERELHKLRSKRLAAGSVHTAGESGEGTLAAFWDAYQM